MGLDSTSLQADAAEAIRQFGQSVGSLADLPASLFAAGRLLELVGDPLAALERYKQAVKAWTAAVQPLGQSSLIALLESLARAAHDSRREEETARWIGSIASTPPERPELAIWQAYLLRLSGLPQKALELLDQANQRLADPAFLAIGAMEQLQALVEIGQLERAQTVCQSLGERAPALKARLDAYLQQLLASPDSPGPGG
ncbi:MAG: hypothetical protein JW797_08795 [Bradymonadales bacterium]|nr:hypothetical protein [Bradymonadales bacterium]